jgi:hypothetical protein
MAGFSGFMVFYKLMKQNVCNEAQYFIGCCVFCTVKKREGFAIAVMTKKPHMEMARQETAAHKKAATQQPAERKQEVKRPNPSCEK